MKAEEYDVSIEDLDGPSPFHPIPKIYSLAAAEPFWASVELVGARATAGRVRFLNICGTAAVELKMQRSSGYTQIERQIYPLSSVFCITPLDEERVRRIVEGRDVTPILHWQSYCPVPAKQSER